ncbi:hypothetical protein BHE74_00036745 [Ensete ventricosum]|nr:hypothetical protein BHE74_00036745 [Ensete ventricosum]RZS13033.1 hypothetical protein BHM03_00044553 [Ensete ventricosum]
MVYCLVRTAGSSSGAGNETASAMMQKFWDSALSLGPLDDDDDSRRLHLDYSGSGHRKEGRGSGSGGLDYAHKDAWAAAYSTVAAGAALIAGIGVMAYLKRSAS